MARSFYSFAVAACLAAWLCPSPALAQMATLETADIRLVYFNPGETYIVPHAVRTFLNSLQFQEQLFKFKPDEKITVLLADFEDSGNAAAGVVPRDNLTVQIAPLNFAFETIAGNDRMNIIMNHELVHIATMDQATSRDRFFRGLFSGKVMPRAEQPESILYFFLTTPRVAAPRWYHEGIAVFVDTWMAGGLGRAQSGYDEMVFRSMVKDGTPFYDPLGLVSEGTKVDFQLQINSYLYGTRFMTWLARRYSPEQLVSWVSRMPGSKGYYSAQFRNVFGTSLEQAWAAWVKEEHEFQQKNLAAIHEHPVTKYRDITSRALGSVSRAYYDADTGKIYAGVNYPGFVGHIGAISVETGAVERIIDIKGPVVYTVTSLAYDPASKTLFYTTDNGHYRDLVRLNPATRKTELLQRDARIGSLAFNRADKSIWGIRHLNGICTIVRIPPPYRQWQRVISLPYGTVAYDLDVSQDGTRVSSSFGDISGKQDVRVFNAVDLMAGKLEPVAHFDFGPSVPNDFTFSADGRYLYGSSYYSGVSNIFRYDLETKEMEALTNAETGFFRPIPVEGDGLIVFRYSGRGFVPTRIDGVPVKDVSAITFLGERVAEEHPVVKSWMVGSPARIQFDNLPKQQGTYRLVRGLRHESFYPIAQGYKDTAAIGGRFDLSDPLQLNHLTLTATYSPDTSLPGHERVHLEGDYERYDWRARVRVNGADFYDLFGPAKTSRKGYYVEAGHTTTLLFDDPRKLDLDLGGRVAGHLDQLPQYQNVPVKVDQLVTGAARLTYSDVRNSLGSVDDETGRRWTAVEEVTAVAGSVISRTLGTFDAGFAVPIPHSSVWFRNAAGFSPQSRSEPFANFFFGGFGNNWVDHLDEKRYRSYERFPGAEIDEIGGRNFFKSMAEWNLPPWRFRRVGTPGFYATWLRPAIFVSGLATNLDAADVRRFAADAGGQVDIRLSLLSALDLTVSTGAAVAFEDGRQPRGEWMLSFKILR
jgi:hypothetical protein